MESQTFYFFHTGLVSGVGLGPSYYPASLLWSPGPRPSPVFRSAICDCLSLNVSISRRPRARVPLVVWAWDFLYAGLSPRSPGPCSPVFFALSLATVVNTRMFLSFSYFLLSLYSSVTAEGQPAVLFLLLLTTAISHPVCWRGPPDSNHGIPCPVAVAVAPAAPAAPAPARPWRTELGQQVRPALRRAGAADSGRSAPRVYSRDTGRGNSREGGGGGGTCPPCFRPHCPRSWCAAGATRATQGCPPLRTRRVR